MTKLDEARDAIWGAATSPGAPARLRDIAIDLSARGFDRTALLGVFGEVHGELAERGREDEAGLVAEAIDLVETWYGDEP